MREVRYFGQNFRIDDQCRYIATDQGGKIYAYTHRPEPGNRGWMIPITPHEANCILIGTTTDLEMKMNWHTSLKSVADIVLRKDQEIKDAADAICASPSEPPPRMLPAGEIRLLEQPIKTLRDEIALEAMKVFLPRLTKPEEVNEMTEQAYNVADAMLARRSKVGA